MRPTLATAANSEPCTCKLALKLRILNVVSVRLAVEDKLALVTLATIALVAIVACVANATADFLILSAVTNSVNAACNVADPAGNPTALAVNVAVLCNAEVIGPIFLVIVALRLAVLVCAELAIWLAIGLALKLNCVSSRETNGLMRPMAVNNEP